MANKIDQKRKYMNILVENINEINDVQNDKIVKSKEIICPKCKEKTFIKCNNNYKINLYNCKNSHTINYLSLDEFEQTQNINLSKIICDKCKINSKGQTFNNQFYKCFNCKINLCPLCKSSHNVKHNILNHNEIHYVCSIHNEKFVKYCNSCKLNICILCEENHINHNTIYLGNIIFNKKELEKKINSLKEDINKLNNNINEIIEIANEVKKNYNKYFIILSNMIINYDIKNRNYENLFNLKELLNNDYIIKNINIFNNEINIRNKFDILFNTYKKMQNQKNEIKLSVKINKEDIGKKIYFLDNTSGDIFVNGKFVSNPVFLKQLNELKIHNYLSIISIINIQNILFQKKKEFTI